MSETQEFAVQVQDLVKIFDAKSGRVTAVDHVNFDVMKGEIFGFLGPNGAGKTTTLEIIEGLQTPTSGSVRVLGMAVAEDSEKVKRRIGVQLQEQSYFKFLQLGELLDLLASFYGVKGRADELLSSVGLSEKKRSLVKELSGGQARRFSIAASLVNDPDVLFLDEPTSGLDPQARRMLWELVAEIRDQGATIVLTTHYMEEAEALCDRVAIIDAGKIKALDAPTRLIQQLDSAYHVRFTSTEPLDEDRLRALPGAVRLLKKDLAEATEYDLEVHSSVEVIQKFPRLKGVDDLRIEPSTLEDVFISLTGKELRD